MSTYSQRFVQPYQGQDNRRFKIYFKINNMEPLCIYDLKIKDYVRFKYDDDFVIDYCVSQILTQDRLASLYRSLDDVDYTPIPLPEKGSK